MICIPDHMPKSQIIVHNVFVTFFLQSIASKKVKKVKKMSFDPLLKTALLRCLVFWFLGSISALLFVAVEYKEKDDKEEKYKLLLSLYESLESKYNMSIEEFNNISRTAHEALSEPKPQWIYLDAIRFIFHAWTTIGEESDTVHPVDYRSQLK